MTSQQRQKILPSEVREYLSGLEGFEFAKAFVAEFEIHPSLVSSVIRITDSVASGVMPLPDLPSVLEKEFELDAETAKRAAVEIACKRLAPIADAIGMDVKGAVVSFGGDPARLEGIEKIHGVPKETVVPEPGLKPSSVAGTSFSDPILQHRLELIVGSYRDGVRTREQAVAVLMRPVKTGGLEMGEQAAGGVLEMAGVTNDESGTNPTNETDSTKDVYELRMGDETAKVATETRENTNGVRNSEMGAKGGDTLTKEDEAEVAAIVEQKKNAMETPRLITDTKAAAEKIIGDAKLTFASGELRTRFEHIIDARLRDVRDGFETRAKLEAAAEQGGVGLSGAALVSVMEMVEEMDAGHHRAQKAQMAQRGEEVRVQKAERAEKAERVQGQEAQVMAKRYAELTGKAPTELVAPVAAARPTSATAAEAVRARDEKIDVSKVKAAIEAAKAPAPMVTPVLSQPSIPASPSGRPKVEDIRFERKLAGPVEELKLLTLMDFRRLSKDPKQAILRVQDKVDLVGQEGYDQRIAAIRAWRASPLSQEYVAVSREALLSGTSIVRVLADRRATGQDALSDEELKAIVELNGILRF